jgi:hypothetical protein
VDVDDPEFWTKMIGVGPVGNYEEVGGIRRSRSQKNYFECRDNSESGGSSGDDSESSVEIPETDEEEDDEEDFLALPPQEL